MKIIELQKHNNKSLLIILRDDDTVQQYCIATNYNPKMRYGQQWDSGTYSFSLKTIMETWNERVLDRIPYDRLSELATLFKDGLLEDDERSAMEYFEDTCEMTESEMEYFGIKESEDE